jgi:hypothetical protein
MEFFSFELKTSRKKKGGKTQIKRRGKKQIEKKNFEGFFSFLI